MAGAFADSKGRYGYRRIKAVLKTGVSEKVVRRIMAEEGLVAHVPCFASMFVRQVRQCFSVVWADGFPRCRHRFPVM